MPGALDSMSSRGMVARSLVRRSASASASRMVSESSRRIRRGDTEAGLPKGEVMCASLRRLVRRKTSVISAERPPSGVVLPRPTSAHAAASGPHAPSRLSASSRLSSSASTPPAAAAAAADDALEHRLLEARLATTNLFKPRSYEEQEADRLVQEASSTAPKAGTSGRKLYLLPPYATGLSNERKLRLLQKARGGPNPS